MARSRNIKPGLFKNEILGEADPIYTLLFAGLWTLADKSGRLENRPKRIRAEIFPYRIDVDVSMALAWLNHEAFITMYEYSKEYYIQINSWKKHQSPHHKEVESAIHPIDGSVKIVDKHAVINDWSKHESCIIQPQPKESASSPLIPDSLNLIPSSLIPDSLIPDSREKTMSRKLDDVSEKQKTKRKAVEDIFEHWKTRMNHSRAQLDAKRIKIITKALGSGYGPEDLTQAVDGCARTPHNMGKNENGQVYDGLHIILKNADQIDRFMRNNEFPPEEKQSETNRNSSQNIGVAGRTAQSEREYLERQRLREQADDSFVVENGGDLRP